MRPEQRIWMQNEELRYEIKKKFWDNIMNLIVLHVALLGLVLIGLGKLAQVAF